MWVDSCTPYFRSLLVWQRKLSTVVISSSQFQSLSGRVCFPSKKSGTFKLCTDTVRFCQGYLFLRLTNNRTIKAEYLNAAWAEFIASTWHVCVNPKFQQCSGQMRSTCSDWNQKHKTEGNFCYQDGNRYPLFLLRSSCTNNIQAPRCMRPTPVSYDGGKHILKLGRNYRMKSIHNFCCRIFAMFSKQTSILSRLLLVDWTD